MCACKVFQKHIHQIKPTLFGQEGQLVDAVIDRVDARLGRIELAAKDAARPSAALRQTMEDLMALSDGSQVPSHAMRYCPHVRRRCVNTWA